MRVFTGEELKKFNGSNGGTVFVACEGKVYDVSKSYHWRKGVHQVTHQAGYDLTQDLKTAPHGRDLLDRFPVVGELIDS